MQRAFLRMLGVLPAPRLEHLAGPALEARLRSIVERGAAPGIAVAALQGDRIALLAAEGKRDLAAGAPATPGTPYLWFSVTKLLTATAVMQLVEQCRVELDRPVRSYVPTFAVESPHRREVTVKHLLSHTAGLANPIPVTWVHLAADRGPDLDDLTGRLLVRHRRLGFEPGTRYAYSNLGYLVLGQLVERASGEAYPEYVRRHVLEPLGCAHSGFVHPGAAAATGYTLTWSLMGGMGRVLIDRRFFAGSSAGFTGLRPFLVDGAPYGGLVGPPSDLARFLAAHLGGGTFDGRRILSEASTAAMQAPQRDLRGRPLPIGLGWHLGEIDGERYAFHLGGGAGFKSELRLYPRLGYGVVVVANETSFDTERITRVVLAP
jgi:CubicO group peptidase (beta-lactamase class C family)